MDFDKIPDCWGAQGPISEDFTANAIELLIFSEV